MSYLHLDILLRLLAAHVIVDFIIQPEKWVKHKFRYKIKSKYLYFHTFLTGMLTYIAFGSRHAFLMTIIVTISHFVLDLGKSYNKKDTISIFFLDQVLHLFVIIICWLVYTMQFKALIQNSTSQFYNFNTILVITAYIIITLPSSIIIAKLTKEWHSEVYGTKGDGSLKNVGKWIGIIERFLVLTFSIIGKYEVIGFLLAAKSVFRFNELKDTKDRKRTEYILIGTLISFTISIILGIAVNYLLIH